MSEPSRFLVFTLFLSITALILSLLLIEWGVNHSTRQVKKLARVVISEIYLSHRNRRQFGFMEGYFYLPQRPRQRIRFSLHSHQSTIRQGDLLFNVQIVRARSLFAPRTWKLLKWSLVA